MYKLYTETDVELFITAAQQLSLFVIILTGWNVIWNLYFFSDRFGADDGDAIDRSKF